MRWPWTSANRLDDLRAELDWLRTEYAALQERNVKLTSDMTRLARREMGLPEEPLKPRPQPEPMPRDIAEHLAGIYPQNIAKAMRDQVYKAQARGETWEQIRAQLTPTDPFESGGPEDAGDWDDAEEAGPSWLVDALEQTKEAWAGNSEGDDAAEE